MTTATSEVGQRVELARYTITGGERLVYGQRIHGIVHVVDQPVDDDGRRHLIERGLTSHAELLAIVADYVDQSQRRDEPAFIVRVGDDLAQRLAPGGR